MTCETLKMTYEKLEKYIELIALSQERYNYEYALELIDVVTGIYGYSESTLDDINYYLTGYRDYEQLKELEKSEQKREVYYNETV